jgi:hypothetical protein
MRTGQQVQTLLPAQFLDQHDYDSPAPSAMRRHLFALLANKNTHTIGSLLVPREIGNLPNIFIKNRARTALQTVCVSVEALTCIRPRQLTAAEKPTYLAGGLQ